MVPRILIIAGLCLSALASGVESSLEQLCGDAMETLVYHLQRGSIGRSENPLEDFMAQSDPALHDPQNPHGTYALESDVLELFRLAPSLRDYETFARKWGLNPEQTTDILTYYSTKVFFDDAEIAGDLHAIQARFRTVSREHYLGEPETPEAQRWLFYHTNVTRFAVPEMARLLGISEGQVYNELSHLQISIVDAFGDRIARATTWLRQNVPLSEIATRLGVGERALEFVLHHTGALNRGVSWERTLPFRGQSDWETVVLVRLRGEGNTHQEIADHLNRLAGITDFLQPDFRTAASVAKRLSELGLTEARGTGPLQVFHPEYGMLKTAGKLNETTVPRFLLDHRQMPEDWLADQLGVTKEGLRAFRQRHHLLGTASRSVQTQKQLHQYEQQVDMIDRLLEWVQAHPGAPLTSEAIETDLKLNASRIFGIGAYAPGKPQSPTAVFNSRDQALLAIRERARQRGIPFRLFDQLYKGELPPQLKAELTKEAIDEYLALSGRVPETFASRLFGTGNYGPQGSHRTSALHENRQQALVAIKKRALERGVPYLLLREELKDGKVAPELLQLMREEAMDLYLAWVNNHDGNPPNQSDFGTAELPVSCTRLFGIGKYKDGAPLHHYALFANKPEAIIALKEHATKMGMPYLTVRETMRGSPPTPELRAIWQQETLDILTSEMLATGTARVNVSLINYNRVFAVSKYAPGEDSHHHAVFSGQSEAFFAIKAAAKRKGIDFLLLNQKWSHPPPAEAKKEMQQEALELLLQWRAANPGKTPNSRDFGNMPNQIPGTYTRFFGIGEYNANGRYPHSRFFDSVEQAMRAVQAEEQRREAIQSAE